MLLLDEVHKYPNWSRELKLIYDDFVNLQVIFTSSSVLEIYKGESDLSRRVVNYRLKELSFREHMLFREKTIFPVLSLKEITNDHTQIATKMIQKFKPLKHYTDFIKNGAYPYFTGNTEEYYQQLRNTINLIMDIDI